LGLRSASPATVPREHRSDPPRRSTCKIHRLVQRRPAPLCLENNSSEQDGPTVQDHGRETSPPTWSLKPVALQGAEISSSIRLFGSRSTASVRFPRFTGSPPTVITSPPAFFHEFVIASM